MRKHKEQELVLKTNIMRESGWLYFIDKDGDLSKGRMGGNTQKKLFKTIIILKKIRSFYDKNPWRKGFIYPGIFFISSVISLSSSLEYKSNSLNINTFFKKCLRAMVFKKVYPNLRNNTIK